MVNMQGPGHDRRVRRGSLGASARTGYAKEWQDLFLFRMITGGLLYFGCSPVGKYWAREVRQWLGTEWEMGRLIEWDRIGSRIREQLWVSLSRSNQKFLNNCTGEEFFAMRVISVCVCFRRVLICSLRYLDIYTKVGFPTI